MAINMTLYDMFFPQMCPYCGELTGKTVESCSDCAEMLKKTKLYSQRLGNGVEVVSAFPYENAFRLALVNYKYNDHMQFFKPFSLTLQRVISEAYADVKFDLFTTVPASNKLSSERYDQVDKFTKRTAKLCRVDYDIVLEKLKDGTPQHELSAKQRRINVIGLFALKHDRNVSGKSVLLFDDTVTTGSTLLACSDILKSSGVSKICCVTLFHRDLKN